MVEAELTAEGKKTKGGIVYGFDEDVSFADEENSWEADVAQVCARVYKVPQELYYNREDQTNSMPWLCDMEVEVGDMLWYNVMESRNAVAVECEGKAYKIIPYRDCYVVKREITPYDQDGIPWRFALLTRTDVKFVVPLNGYVLLEPLYKENKSFLAVDKKGEVDKTRGIVRFVGKPNKEYLNENYVDFLNLEVGDEVLLAPNTALWYLERKKYLSSFNDENLYWVTQRRRISMVLSKGN